MKPVRCMASPLVTLWLLISGVSLADERAEQSVREEWQRVYRGIAQSITMRRADTTLTMLDQPLLFYTNPVRNNDQHGAIFLWTEGGKPAVIGSIWSALNRQNPDVRFVTHELHSLSVHPEITATRNEENLWTSGEVGISWQRLEGVAPPATSPAQRLAQMRSIMRRYSVTIDVEGESDLRLLNQPLYRYPQHTEGVLDGAVFAFAMTTDPELLILLEAREEDSKAAWHIAFARFGNKAMLVKEDDRAVWSCKAGAPGVSDGKYYLRWRAEEMPATPKPVP